MRRNQNFLSSANPRIISESNHTTRKRRSPFNVRNSSFSQNFIIKFRRKAESRADDADIFLGENLSFFYVRYRENGAPEISEILLRGAHRAVENFSLRRLKFSSMMDAPAITAATGASIPALLSEKPETTPKRSAISLIFARCMSSGRGLSE